MKTETKIDLTHTIGGYEIELDFDDDGRSQCYVTFKRYGASLACLSDMGYLTHTDTIREHHVPVRIIGEIEKWAEAHGY